MSAWLLVLGLVVGIAAIGAIPITAYVLLGPGLERMLEDLFPQSSRKDVGL